MKAVLQRVSRASVSVAGKTVAAIEHGFVVLLGVAAGDDESHAVWMARKITELRVFSDEQGKFNLSLRDVHGSALVVSQFTLLGATKKGRRPGFTEAAPPELAEPLVARVVDLLRESGIKTESGRFGAKMSVEIINDGPVTLLLDSRQ